MTLLLFAFSVSPVTLAFWVMVGVGGVAAGLWWFRKDEAQEDRDMERIRVVGLLEKIRFPHMAEIVGRFVVRDFSGLVRECVALRKRAAEGEASLLQMLEPNFFDYQLPARWKVPEQRDRIVKMVEEFRDRTEAEEKRAKEAFVNQIAADPELRDAVAKKLGELPVAAKTL